MSIKLTTEAQVALLKVGDVIRRFPFNAQDATQDVFDEQRTRHIGTYEVGNVNLRNGIYLLISANSRTAVCTSPVDISRLYINASDLITEKVWWVNS